jgi:hypothetical protein
VTEQCNAFTIRELYELPAAVDLMTAARALHMGRTMAYKLARSGEFPCRLLRYGGTSSCLGMSSSSRVDMATRSAVVPARRRRQSSFRSKSTNKAERALPLHMERQGSEAEDTEAPP